MSDAAARAAELADRKLTPPIELADTSPPPLSDDALAQRFAERYSKNLCYIADWSHWYEWNGARWAREPTHHAFDRARAICRVAASEVDKSSTKTRLASAKTVAAVERLAKVDRRIAATVDQWDTDPDVFNSEEPLP